AIHPGNGEEMRQLPKKEDREEHPGPRVERSPSRRPADHRWNRARNCAEGRVERADELQRRVSEKENNDRDRGESGAERIADEGEISDTENRQRSANDQGLGWLHSTGWNRAGLGSLHQRVEFAFPPLIERGRAGGSQ